MNDRIIKTNKDCHIYVQDEVKENSIYVYILQKNNYNGTKVNQIIIQENNEPSVFDFTDDGYYTLCTLEVPTESSEEYYYKNGKFYYIVQEVPLLELINKVPTHYLEYFNLCHLKRCFVNLCQEIFDKNIQCKNKVVDSYKRDLIWATISVIEYMTEIDLYVEAERLLLRVTGCNGICENNNCNCG